MNDDGEIEFSALVTAAAEDDHTITAFGSEILSAKPKYLIGLTTRVETPAGNALLPAGNPITVKGTIRNLSNTAELDLGPLYPEMSGNAGIASVAYDSVGTDPRWPIPPEVIHLEPGESRDFTVRVTTSWSDPRTNAIVERHGGTCATLRFTPWGRATEEDGTVVDIDPDTQVLASAADLEKVVHIDDSIPIPPTDYLAFGGGILVGVVEGVWGAAAALVMSIPERSSFPTRTCRHVRVPVAGLEQLHTGGEGGVRKRRGTDGRGGADAQRRARRAGTAALFTQAKAMTLTVMEDLADEWAVGDYTSTVQAYTSAAANVITSIVLPIGLGKLAKTPAVAAALARAQSAIQQRMAPLLGRVRDCAWSRRRSRSLSSWSPAWN